MSFDYNTGNTPLSNYLDYLISIHPEIPAGEWRAFRDPVSGKLLGELTPNDIPQSFLKGQNLKYFAQVNPASIPNYAVIDELGNKIDVNTLGEITSDYENFYPNPYSRLTPSQAEQQNAEYYQKYLGTGIASGTSISVTSDLTLTPEHNYSGGSLSSAVPYLAQIQKYVQTHANLSAKTIKALAVAGAIGGAAVLGGITLNKLLRKKTHKRRKYYKVIRNRRRRR